MSKYNNEKNQPLQKRKLISILLLLILILVATNIWTALFYIPNRLEGNNSNSQYNLLDPARGFYSEKDLITNFQPLRNELNKIGEDKNISIYFEYLDTGANIAINKDADFFPASLLKLPLAMTAVKKIERGEWQWDNELVLMYTDKDDRYGNLYKQPIGTRFTIEDLIRKITIDSDNTAYLIILRNLEANEFDNTVNQIGLKEFFDKDGKISAKKYAVILRALYSASYLTPEDSQKLLSIMSEAKFNKYLSAGLPDNVVFAHKFGVSNEEDVHLDAGIVYAPSRSYFLIAMIHTNNKEFARKKMKEISEKVYSYVANYRSENL